MKEIVNKSLKEFAELKTLNVFYESKIFTVER